jgi:hypothetical protein
MLDVSGQLTGIHMKYCTSRILKSKYEIEKYMYNGLSKNPNLLT